MPKTSTRRKKIPSDTSSGDANYESLELKVEELRDALYFMKRKFSILLLAAFLLIFVFAMLYMSEKVKSDIFANLLSESPEVSETVVLP